MRILLITDWLRLRGGVERYFLTLRDGLRQRGHDVALLTSTAADSASDTAEYRAFGTERRAAQAFLQIANPPAALAVNRAARAFRPDVALVGMFEQHLSPAILPALGEVPNVLSVADYKPICPLHTKLLPDGTLCTVQAGAICMQNDCVGLLHWLRDRPRYALIRRGLDHADRILACSAWLRDALAADGIRSRALTLPTLAPSAAYRRAPASSPCFVFVGRLSREKGVATLLNAFARLTPRIPEATLRIVGDGEQRAELERLAEALGIASAVTFTGWRDASQIEEELSHAWASVAPSLWAEPFGLVAAEAVVRGVPVIASAAGGLREIVIPGESGLLVANGDEAALLAALEAIATRVAFPNQTLSSAVVEQALRQSSVERHLTALEEVFAGAIAREPAGS